MIKAILTGHSRGLGAALAEHLTRDGVTVLGISRTAGTTVDLADPAAVIAWLDGGELASYLSDADDIVVINNAGTVEPMAPVGQADAAATANAVNLNVTAALLLTDAVLRHRQAGARVRIAHISSGAGRRSYPGWAVYCATKAALDMHAQTLAAEHHPGVRVASIAPGIVDTAMQEAIRESATFPLRDRFAGLHEAGQLVAPADAAAQVVALLNRDDFGERVVADVRYADD